MELMEKQELQKKIKELEDIIVYQRSVIDSFKSLSTPQVITSDHSPTNREIISTTQRFKGYALFQSNIVYYEPSSSMSFILEDPDLFSMFSWFNSSPAKFDNCYNEADLIVPEYTKGLGRLPIIKDIDLLLNYFFDTFFSFILFFNKDSILSQLHQLLEDNGDHSVIKPSKSGQSSLIAILLLMLRLAYFTISPKNANLLNLDSCIIINESYVECAVGLLMSPQSYKNLKLHKIQGLLLLRVYKMFCHEDDDSSYSTCVVNAALVLSARVLGLHRGISNYPTQFLNKAEVLLWEKIWNHICYFDIAYSFNKGVLPLTHMSEVENLPHTATDCNSRSEYLMALTSKCLRKFMEGEISQRQINICEVHDLLSAINDILLKKSKTIQQLAYDNEVSQFDSVDERANEFIFRIDLIYKEFCVYFLLASTKESWKKNISLAFERCLILFRIIHEKAVQHREIFGGEIDRLIFARLWMGPRMIIMCIVKMIKHFTEGEISILECFKYFNCPDSIGIMDWVNMDFRNEKETLKNLVKNLVQIYIHGFESSLVYYSCFKACMFMKYSLSYLDLLYPEFGILEDINCQPVPFQTVIEGWMKKDDAKNFANIENLFGIQNNELANYLGGMEF